MKYKFKIGMKVILNSPSQSDKRVLGLMGGEIFTIKTLGSTITKTPAYTIKENDFYFYEYQLINIGA